MAETSDKALPPSSHLTEEDLRAARGGPAIYANRVVVNLEAVVRVAFMEQSPEGTFFRTAVALPHQTAIETANLLKHLLAAIEADLERFKAEAAAQTKTSAGGADGH